MPKTIDEYLSFHAENQENTPVYTYLKNGDIEDIVVTFKELYNNAQRVGQLLVERKLKQHRVMIICPYGLSFIESLVGCFYSGNIAVPVNPPRLNRPDPAIEYLFKAASPSAILSTSEFTKKMDLKLPEDSPLRSVEWISVDMIDPTTRAKDISGNAAIDDLALIQFTSGSTSTPKGVAITHKNIIENQKMIQHAFGHSTSTIGLGWLPMYHDMGLIGNVMQCLFVGYPMILLPPLSVIQKPLRWLDAISKYRATSSGGPNFIYDHCIRRIKDTQCDELNLESWDLAFNGSEPIWKDTMDDFSEKFSPFGFKKTAFYPCYGLAEATLIVSGGAKSSLPKTLSVDAEKLKANILVPASNNSQEQTLVSSGQPLLEQQCIVVNPATRTACSENEIGSIWIAGRNVSNGFFLENSIDTSAFEYHLNGNTTINYYDTGDLGAMIDGELYVTGRRKELVIIGGKNYYPHDIELTVKSCDSLFEDQSTVAFSIEQSRSEQLVVIQEVRYTPNSDDNHQRVKRIQGAIFDTHTIPLSYFCIVPFRTIKKTSSGKLMRSDCKKRFIEKTLNPLYEWTKDTVPNLTAS